MDNRQHGERVYNLLKDNVPAQYEVLSGTHYDIYDKGRMKATRMARVRPHLLMAYGHKLFANVYIRWEKFRDVISVLTIPPFNINSRCGLAGRLACHLDNCLSHFVRKLRPTFHKFCQAWIVGQSVFLILSSISQAVFGSPLFTRAYNVLQ